MMKKVTTPEVDPFEIATRELINLPKKAVSLPKITNIIIKDIDTKEVITNHVVNGDMIDALLTTKVKFHISTIAGFLRITNRSIEKTTLVLTGRKIDTPIEIGF